MVGVQILSKIMPNRRCAVGHGLPTKWCLHSHQIILLSQ